MIYFIHDLKIIEIKELGVYCYLIIAGENNLLIDTGLPSFSKLLWKGIQSHISSSNILAVNITHADPDHIGGLSALRNRIKLNVSAPLLEKDAILAGRLSREIHPHGFEKIPYKLVELLTKMTPEAVDDTLIPASTHPVLTGMRVIATPGHTSGHCSLFMEREGVLFSGDSINYAHGKLTPSTGANNWDENSSRSSFEVQKKLKPEWIFAGHFSLSISGKHGVWST
jgi:glyoxylase-like metal-dependent hydrolase (beta-lactamase superfamily II)